MPIFRDMADSNEDTRITAIVQQLGIHERVGFITDDTEGKVDRYIQKIKKLCPMVEVEATTEGPIPGAITVVVRLATNRN